MSNIQNRPYGTKQYEQWIVATQRNCHTLQLEDKMKESDICSALFTYTEHLRVCHCRILFSFSHYYYYWYCYYYTLEVLGQVPCRFFCRNYWKSVPYMWMELFCWQPRSFLHSGELDSCRNFWNKYALCYVLRTHFCFCSMVECPSLTMDLLTWPHSIIDPYNAVTSGSENPRSNGDTWLLRMQKCAGNTLM